jgi:gamma-glutamyltranspeptidase/glutathione hydrolase
MNAARGMVSAPQPLAVEAGVDILARGGNAIDAAVAVAFVQGVVDPQMCGLGGGGTTTVYLAGSGETKVCNFYARVPFAAAPDMFAKAVIGEAPWGGFLLERRINEVGYLSLCTPAAPRGLAALHQTHARLSWSDVLAPSISIAEEGAPVYHHVHDRWMRSASAFADSVTRHSATQASARQYMRDGRMLEPGERMDTKDYARTLRRIASHGAEDFHQGEIADCIVADMIANGGFIRHDDLREAQASWAKPIEGQYRGYTVKAPPPPGGGVAIISILNALSGWDLKDLGYHSSEHLDVLARAIRLGLSDWKAHTGDPAFVESPVSWLISQERAREIQRAITERVAPPPGARSIPDSRDTTHVSVVDAEGNAVSITHTLALGSGVVTDGLGFMYNNALMLFDPHPNRVNSIAPGRIRQHATAPCLLFKDGELVIALGAPGGHGIVSGVVQTICNIVDFGMSPHEAVSAPRIHCESDIVEMEARFPRAAAQALDGKGHKVRHSVYSYDFQSGRPHVVMRDPKSGRFSGGADPRAGGMALEA